MSASEPMEKEKSNKHCDNNASHVVFRSVIVMSAREVLCIGALFVVIDRRERRCKGKEIRKKDKRKSVN